MGATDAGLSNLNIQKIYQNYKSIINYLYIYAIHKLINRQYRVNTGNCAPIICNLTNNRPTVVKHSTNKRLVPSGIHDPDDKEIVLPLNKQRIKCTMSFIRI